MHYFLFFGAFDECFYPVGKHAKELRHVFLDQQVDWAAINIFESSTELFRIKVLLFNFHQPSENALHLIESVFFIWLLILISVLHF